MNLPLLVKLNSTAMFLAEAVNRPRQVGAIAPSSPRLAAAMARWIPDDPEAYVLELGPGTGAVTEAMLKAGLRQEKLVAIEKSTKLVEHLRHKYPAATIIDGDALELDEQLLRTHGCAGPVAAVFSSLPMLNFPPETERQLAERIHAVLKPGGRLVQYTYHLSRERDTGLDLFREVASDVIWLNLPPARVTVHQR